MIYLEVGAVLVASNFIWQFHDTHADRRWWWVAAERSWFQVWALIALAITQAVAR